MKNYLKAEVKPGNFKMNGSVYAQIPALSFSSIKELDKSPANFVYTQNNPRKQTPAMLKGIAVHTAVLEPDVFRKRAMVWSGGTKRGALWDAWKAKSGPDAIILSQVESDELNQIIDAVHSHPVAGPLVATGSAERSLIWKDEGRSFYCKTKPDLLRKDIKIIVELKTAADISPDAFSRAIYTFKYHWQAAYHIHGANVVQSKVRYQDLVFIAVETNPPYNVAVYEADPVMIDDGRNAMRPIFDLFESCLKDDTWPIPYDKVQTISLPPWAR